MDLISRIKNLNWKRTKSYSILGGYNDVYTANNGDKIILSTCNTVSTKYVINGKVKGVYGDVENYIYKVFR